MDGFLWVAGGGTVLVAGIVSYAMTRRYGWGAALALPVMALVAFLGMQWQERATTGYEPGLASLALAAPVLLGAVAGIAVARLRRG